MSGPRTVSPGARCGTVTIPSSKSHVHRLLIAAALGESPVSIRLRGLSKDILATADCLRAMGAEIGCHFGKCLIFNHKGTALGEGK